MTSILEVEQLDTLSSNASSTITIGGTNATTLNLGSNITGGSITNTPAFFANKTSDQTLTNNTFVKITFDSEVFDTDSAFDLANDKFTVPSGKGGKYVIGTSLYTDAGAVSNYQYGNIKLYLNGAEKTHTIFDPRNNPSHQLVITHQAILDLSASDYIEVYCRISDLSGSPFIDGNSSTYQSYFYGYRIGS